MRYPTLRLDYPRRLMIFMACALCGLMAASACMAVCMVLMDGITTPAMRISAVFQDLLLFIAPAVATAVYVSAMPARLLCADKVPDLRLTLLAVAALMTSVPAMNAIVEWNAAMKLPEWASGLEAWMRASEQSAQNSVETMLAGKGVVNTILCVLIVGVLAGVSEELFFRGALQRLVGSGPLGIHTTIWLTAIIFSLFHMQFFGFVPRVLLGAYFGYLLYWSGSVWLAALAHVLNNTVYVVSARHAVASGVNTVGADSPLMIALSVAVTAFLLAVMVKESHKSQ